MDMGSSAGYATIVEEEKGRKYRDNCKRCGILKAGGKDRSPIEWRGLRRCGIIICIPCFLEVIQIRDMWRWYKIA